jgi:aromatic amino acid aminotransferase I
MAPPSAIDIEGVTDTQAVVLLNALTVNGVPARRAKAGKLVAGTAAYTSSDFFKGPVSISSYFRVSVLIIGDLWKTKS